VYSEPSENSKTISTVLVGPEYSENSEPTENFELAENSERSETRHPPTVVNFPIIKKNAEVKESSTRFLNFDKILTIS